MIDLEGIATDAVHLTRYSNAGFIIILIINLKEVNADKNVDKVIPISINIKRKLKTALHFKS